MSLSHIHLPPWVRVLITTASVDKQCHSTGMSGLNGLLSITRVVSIELLKSESGAVTGVAKGQCQLFAGHISGPQNGHLVIHRTLRVWMIAEGLAIGAGCSSVHGEATACEAVMQMCRLKTCNAVADHRRQPSFQFRRVSRCFLRSSGRLIGCICA